jgi:N-acetylglucosamine kinase-like BadF-type ATPase
VRDQQSKSGGVLAADIGRTTCRLARYEHGARVATAERPCGVSLSDVDGVDGIRRVVAATLRTMPPAPLTSVVLGVTGAATSSAAARALRVGLESELGVPVTVTGDVVTAHAGGLGGEHGVLTIAGTGAIALAVSASGAATLVDGWGPLLGDAGSAADVGRAGLVAALRAHDGRNGGSIALAAAARKRFGDLDGLPGRVHGDAHGIRSVAAFATNVAIAARAGDRIACGIFADAVADLVDTTLTACRHARSGDVERVGVVLAGGLFDLGGLVAGPVRAALAADPLVTVRPAAGDALDGAYALAAGRAGLHHRLVWVRQAPNARGAGAAAAAITTREEI